MALPLIKNALVVQCLMNYYSCNKKYVQNLLIISIIVIFIIPVFYIELTNHLILILVELLLVVSLK